MFVRWFFRYVHHSIHSNWMWWVILSLPFNTQFALICWQPRRMETEQKRKMKFAARLGNDDETNERSMNAKSYEKENDQKCFFSDRLVNHTHTLNTFASSSSSSFFFCFSLKHIQCFMESTCCGDDGGGSGSFDSFSRCCVRGINLCSTEPSECSQFIF